MFGSMSRRIRPLSRWVWFDPDSNRGSTAILHVQPDDIWRIDVQVDGTIPDETLLDETNVKRIIDCHLAMMEVTASYTLVWRSVYRAHAVTLDTYRDGRAFLAGDAAHLVPIFGVRGLNSDIDDAHNLAWKLAAAFSGIGNSKLLDSYTAERRRATLENLGNAVKSTWFMSPPTDGFRLMRDAALLLARDQDWARSLINPRQSTAHVYSDTPCLANSNREEGGMILPGSVLPNLPLTDREGHLHDMLPHACFSLIIDGLRATTALIETIRHLETAVPARVIVLGSGQDCAVNLDDQKLLFPDELPPIMVVRPDEHIVGWCGDATECNNLLAIGTGHNPDWAIGPVLAAEDASSLILSSPAELIFERLAVDIDSGNLLVTTVDEAASALLEAYEAEMLETD